MLDWVPALGVSFAFRLDGLALAFALLICGIGALILLYASAYFRNDARLGKLLATLSAFAISMLGLVTADDMITLFLFWEGTTITSWLLVGFDHDRATARAAALQALLVTAAGGLALLAGLVLLAQVAGTGRLSALPPLGANPAYPAIALLILLGCLTKSAQFPFHFWLPNAMAAPTPVSAYLHSATMVKAGVYLIARLTPSLGGTELWAGILMPAGGITMLLGSVWALRQSDLKLMLAHTTVMGLGLLTLLLGIGTPAAVTAAMAFLLTHALYKASLFLATGLIEKGAGSREHTAVGGLARAMPRTAAIVALAALSMAGLPPLLGFIAKELSYEAVGPIATAAILVASALMLTCAAIVALRPFTGERRSPKPPADPAAALWIGPALLAVLGLLFGCVPSLAEWIFVAPMVRSVTGEAMHHHLALWHGLNPALGLSFLTWALGIAVYRGLGGVTAGLARVEPHLPRAESGYIIALSAVTATAAAVTRRLQGGEMTAYLRRTFLAFGLLVAGALALGQGSWPSLKPSDQLVDWGPALMIAASSIAVLRTRTRLTAIASLGGIGAGIALIFVAYGAVDVAMTQLFAEILVVVFLAAAMTRFPDTGAIAYQPRNVAVAVLLGVAVTGALLATLGTSPDPLLSRYFEAESVPAAHGHNIVNVILVDFRGFDTLGEISVIVIAGLAATAALKAGRRAK